MHESGSDPCLPARVVERNGSKVNSNTPNFETASRDAVSTAPVAREAHAHEAEPETIERQFVRWAYGDDCQLPHLPASHEPKPRRPGPIPPINRYLAALNSVGCDYRPALNDVDSWQALCPTHQDTRPSLSVTRNADGSIYFRCWAGCSKEGILAALGLEWRDLWDASEHDHGRRKPLVKPLLPLHLRQAMERMLKADDERRAA